MVGRTNAGGGGGLKYLTGTFTTSQTEVQKSFTVSGVTFDPKIIVVNRLSDTIIHNYGGDYLAFALSDYDNGWGYTLVANADNAGSHSSARNAGSKLTKSLSGNILTVTSTYTAFCDSSYGDVNTYSTYQYYLYG